MSRTSLLRIAVAATLAFCTSVPARAQTQVDVLLVLAVDASGSVNDVRFELQKQGYVAAFRHPNVLRAIRSGMQGAIAVTMTQWTGPSLQAQVVPWTLLKDQASVLAFASAIEKAPRELFSGGTSISGAIDHAMLLLPSAPFKGTKRVIDISGDGSNNRGRPVHAGARRRGARRRHRQRPADPVAGAVARQILFRECDRRPGLVHDSGGELREIRRRGVAEAGAGDCVAPALATTDALVHAAVGRLVEALAILVDLQPAA